MKRLGIWGSGQLGLMLAEAAIQLKVPVNVFCQFLDDPAAQLTDVTKISDQSKSDSLDFFLNNSDIVVFENEFVDVSRVSGPENLDKFFPSLTTMDFFSQKLNQKILFDDLHLRHPRWKELSCHDVNELIEFLREHFASGAVLKWSKFGYDGYGNFVWKPEFPAEDNHALWGFYEKARSKKIRVFAEEWIPFDEELAMAGCRSRDGSFVFYPLVKTKQKNGACHQVRGPASAWGVPPSFTQEAQRILRLIAEAKNLWGTFAVEFFRIKSDELLLNEVAPRVHNTAHYSQWAARCSQFENHVRSAMSLDLKEPETSPYFGMLNLLGPCEADDLVVSLPASTQTTQYYWYGKKHLRKGRKMGHLNFRADTRDAVVAAFAQGEAWEYSLWSSLSARQPQPEKDLEV